MENLSKEKQIKQIEELAEDILQEYTNCYSEVDKEVLAKMIYNADYRKQSDVIDEFAKRLKEYPINNLEKSFTVAEIIDEVAMKMKGETNE